MQLSLPQGAVPSPPRHHPLALSPWPALWAWALALALPEPSLPQAFFCGRSDYFRALLDDHFRENEELEASGGLPAITLHGISPDVFTHVLYYIYSDHTEVRGPGGPCALGRAGMAVGTGPQPGSLRGLKGGARSCLAP